MEKLAAIYTRVSTKRQGEKSSLDIQEASCRKYAEEHGYLIYDHYQDIESATQTEQRKTFSQLVLDAKAGKFEVVLAWKWDRLLRSITDRDFYDFLVLYQNGSINIELTTQPLDRSYVLFLVAVAENETKIRVDRVNMGLKARLRKNKQWLIDRKYGYAVDENDEPIINEDEAQWIRQIFDWYLDEVGVREICRRLIAKGVPQKHGISDKPWPTSIVYRYLNDETYTGIHKVRRGGEVFEIDVPIIIEPEKFREVQRRKKANINTPKGNTKHNYLLRGLLYSPCDTKWQAVTRRRKGKYTVKSGEVREYDQTTHVYYCARGSNAAQKDGKQHHPDCPRTKGVVRLDKAVWEKVSEVLRNPDLLVSAAEERLNELRDQHQDATKRKTQLSKSLQKLEDERQAYIELFGKSEHFTQDDLDTQLDRIAGESLEIKRELVQIEMLADTRFSDLDALVNLHLKDISRALEWLDKESETDEDKQRQFEERKAIVDMLVKRVTISKNADPIIEFVIDIFGQNSSQIA